MKHGMGVRAIGARIAVGARAGALSAAALLCAAVLLVGCTSAAGEEAPASPPPEAAEAPLTEAQLIGRWQAPEPSNREGFVELTEYGIWFASDGCNPAEGSWWIDEGGLRFDSLSVRFTIGCHEGIPIPDALHVNGAAELDANGELDLGVFPDERIVLERTREQGTSLVGTWVGPASEASLTEVVFDAGGGVVARTPCGLNRGTWKLGRADLAGVDRPFRRSIDASFVPSAGLLRIDAESVEVGDCGGDLAKPSIGEGSEYSFRFAGSETFLVSALAGLDSAHPDPDDLPGSSLAFHRIG